jgi:hypothetical protein
MRCSRQCLSQELFLNKKEANSTAPPARVAPASAGLDPIFIGFLLRRLVEVAERGQQRVELGLGQAGHGFHLTVVSDEHPHRLALSMVF